MKFYAIREQLGIDYNNLGILVDYGLKELIQKIDQASWDLNAKKRNIINKMQDSRIYLIKEIIEIYYEIFTFINR